jgi:hypothetical protein
VSEWTIDTSREHLLALIGAMDRRLAAERDALTVALQTRAQDMERRLAALNELRNEVLADRALFVTRDAFTIVAERVQAAVTREYYDEQHASLEAKVDINTATIAAIRSRSAAYTAGITFAFLVLAGVIAAVSLAH